VVRPVVFFAHVLHGGRAVTAALDTAALAPEDEEFLGLPGLLSAEQTAAVLFRRDEDHRRRASSSRTDDAAAAEREPVAPATCPGEPRGICAARFTAWWASSRRVPA
jgi:hypothetical protein